MAFGMDWQVTVALSTVEAALATAVVAEMTVAEVAAACPGTTATRTLTIQDKGRREEEEEEKRGGKMENEGKEKGDLPSSPSSLSPHLHSPHPPSFFSSSPFSSASVVLYSQRARQDEGDQGDHDPSDDVGGPGGGGDGGDFPPARRMKKKDSLTVSSQDKPVSLQST